MLDLAVDYTPRTNAQSHKSNCEACVYSQVAHEYRLGVWHIPSNSRGGLIHEVSLNVGSWLHPLCSCEHGRGKGRYAPLRCRHYEVAKSLYQKKYGEIVPPDPREPKQPVVVRVVESNGVELFGNDEPRGRSKLEMLFDKCS